MSKRILKKMTYSDCLQWLADNDDLGDGVTICCGLVADIYGKDQDDVARSAYAIYQVQHQAIGEIKHIH